MNIQLLLFFIVLISAKAYTHNTSGGIRVELDDFTFILPAFAGEYKTREASIAPTEAELADKLQALLNNNDKQSVLTELDTFFDLQLSPAMLHLKGQVYFSIGEYEEAEEIFQTVLLRMPQFIRAHVDISVLYLKQEKYAKARDHLAKAISYGEGSAKIYGQLGYLNMKLHNAQSSISAYQQALMLEPTNTYWQNGLLTALTDASMIDAALALSEEMIRTQNKDTRLALNRAFLFLKMGNELKALENLEYAFTLGDTNPVNYSAAAQLHLKMNSFERAVELMELLAADGKLELDIVSQSISWLASNSQWDIAEKLIGVFTDTVNTLNARDQSQFYLQIAIVFSNTDRENLAEQYFNQSIDTDPSNAKGLLEFARFHHGKKKHIAADTLYTRASVFDETKKHALLGRSQIMVDLGDYKSALSLSRRILREYPDLTYLSDNIRALENLVRLKEHSDL